VVEIKAACLSEFVAAIQTALGLEDEVRMSGHDEDFGDFVGWRRRRFMQLPSEHTAELPPEVGEAI
jgi:hypothetical protein